MSSATDTAPTADKEEAMETNVEESEATTHEENAESEPPPVASPSVVIPPAAAMAAGADTLDQLMGIVAPGQENTGRWTKAEHAAFLKGIEKFGKEWKKVAAIVKTRTVMQTRTHAQKYFEKLAALVAKQSGTPMGKPTTSSSIKKNPLASTANTAKKIGVAGALKSPPHGGMGASPFGSPSAPLPIVNFTELDILVPISDATALRTANKEYMDMMKANCFIFHSLPVAEQVWFVRNLVNFITVVRGRRWIACNFYHAPAPHTPQYQLLTDATTVVQNDFRMDPLKVAGFAFHPFWLLGEHDPGNAHNGMPFLHRTVDGTWKSVTTNQVRDILKGEGPKNLLLLPPTVHLEAATAPPSAATSADTEAAGEEPSAEAAAPAAADDMEDDDEAVTMDVAAIVSAATADVIGAADDAAAVSSLVADTDVAAAVAAAEGAAAEVAAELQQQEEANGAPADEAEVEEKHDDEKKESEKPEPKQPPKKSPTKKSLPMASKRVKDSAAVAAAVAEAEDAEEEENEEEADEDEAGKGRGKRGKKPVPKKGGPKKAQPKGKATSKKGKSTDDADDVDEDDDDEVEAEVVEDDEAEETEPQKKPTRATRKAVKEEEPSKDEAQRRSKRQRN